MCQKNNKSITNSLNLIHVTCILFEFVLRIAFAFFDDCIDALSKSFKSMVCRFVMLCLCCTLSRLAALQVGYVVLVLHSGGPSIKAGRSVWLPYQVCTLQCYGVLLLQSLCICSTASWSAMLPSHVCTYSWRYRWYKFIYVLHVDRVMLCLCCSR